MCLSETLSERARLREVRLGHFSPMTLIPLEERGRETRRDSEVSAVLGERKSRRMASVVKPSESERSWVQMEATYWWSMSDSWQFCRSSDWRLGSSRRASRGRGSLPSWMRMRKSRIRFFWGKCGGSDMSGLSSIMLDTLRKHRSLREQMGRARWLERTGTRSQSKGVMSSPPSFWYREVSRWVSSG